MTVAFFLLGSTGTGCGDRLDQRDKGPTTDADADTDADSDTDTDTDAQPPNILFVVMDDVGIDQMATFGYGGPTAPSTPTIETLGGSGVRFGNTWSMPACTPSRAVFFDGRFPVRTHVYGALGPSDLANSMVSPYEVTTPKLLADAGYQSGIFGKFHLGIQGHNPDGLAMPHALGWDYFYGWLDETGDPSSIDTTGGGLAPPGTWPCGFVPAAPAGGANAGACHHADGTCAFLSGVGPVPPGRVCRDGGGIFDPSAAACGAPPDALDFSILNAHYVSPLTIVEADGTVIEVPPTDPRARTWRATAVVDGALEWIGAQPEGQPWMASVMFASAHTPVMQPPGLEGDPSELATSSLRCDNPLEQRTLTNLLIESLDTELARLLVGAGLATVGGAGELVYDPASTDTMVVIVGDNGSLGNTVKAPFNPSRAKGTAYQTGVWVPLIVAGPLVDSPDRTVSSMVNIADLFELFGELAGIDVHSAVPHALDSAPLLPYLLDPSQPSLRSTNFTQIGQNLQVGSALNGPCWIGASCTQIPVSKGVCEDNGGVWYGAGSDVPGGPQDGFLRCCEVADYVANVLGEEPPTINPDLSAAVRDDRYKLVRNTTFTYVSADVPCEEQVTDELYVVDEAVPTPQLDDEGTELPLDALSADQQTHYDLLLDVLNDTLSQGSDCPGDGTLDRVVDQTDLDGWAIYEGLGSSVFDFDLDGLTTDDDRSIIEDHLAAICQP